MYKVKRFSILGQKEFTKIGDLKDCISFGNKFTTEFIKCMEMYASNGGAINHWISGMLGNISNLRSSALMYFTPSIVLARTVMNKDLITNPEVSREVSELYGSDFIRSVKSSIVSSKKYPSLSSLNSFSYDDKYYSRVLTILVHVLNKKIDVDSIDTSSIWDYSFDTKKVDFTTDKVKVKFSDEELHKLICKFLYHLNGDSGILKDSI